MNNLARLLAVRRELKAKKPNFLREDNDKFENKQVGLKWRRPTGRHSKIKHQFKGSRKMPNHGYRAPVLVRGMMRSGYFPVIVCNIEDLNKIDAGKDTVIISSTVGKRKRIGILSKILEKKLHVGNMKDVAGTIKSIQDKFASQKVKQIAEKIKKQEEKKEVLIEQKQEKPAEQKPEEKKTLNKTKKGESA